MRPDRPTLQSLGGWHQAILESDLTATQKGVLFSLVFHADWDSGGSCYPAIATICRDTSRSDRLIQKTIKELVATGIIEFEVQSHGGPKATHHLQLRLEKIKARRRIVPPNPEATSGLSPPQNPEKPAPQPRSPGVLTPKILQANPEATSGDHTIHNKPINQTIKTNHEESGMAESLRSGWMDGKVAVREEDMRSVLECCGVRGHALNVFADDPRITPELVKHEWRDVGRGKNIRDRTAVLVTRLTERFNIKISKSSRILEEDLRGIGEIERLRRLRSKG